MAFDDPNIGTPTTRGLYARADLVINAQQAEALAALLWDGKHAGTSLEDCEPPRTAALYPGGPRESLDMPELRRDRKSGEYVTDKGHRVLEDPPMPAANTLLVLAPDGRAWQCARAGIMWPMPPSEEASQ